ncbi:MAG TPA: serine protease [Pyrinomonadaceae bacterium]|jgi:S1-C subfamily serine protease
MKRGICVLALAAVCAPLLLLLVAPAGSAADAPDESPLADVLRRGGYTVSLDLRVRKKKRDSLQHFLEILDGEAPPNAYATGFVVGDGLVMTAYHTVSGELSAGKRKELGFSRDESLEVAASVNGCGAAVLKVDAEADLALLQVCRAKRRSGAPAFQAAPARDDELLVIARPNGARAVRRGVLSGTYDYRGRQFWAATIEGRDGFSGSPVYNGRGEIVGVFSGYDSARKVSLISPAARAQKLLEDYASGPKR